MKEGLIINKSILTWAIARAGFDLPEFTEKYPNVLKWINDEKNPTVKQLEEFSKKVHIPFGYLFLNEPPQETIPFPFFRTKGQQANKVNLNIFDTIRTLQKRQDWLREYLIESDFENLDFVGKYKDKSDVDIIVKDIRQTLKLNENWASEFSTWGDAQDHLVTHIEDKGIIVVFNGVVENNGHRKIPIEECRGFVLVDEYCPFMFINNADYKSAQMFTILHELAHIWIGRSAGFDSAQLLPANDPIEILCDKVAAEFLVPKNAFDIKWQQTESISTIARHFKVSEIVIARRALDNGKLSKGEFFNFYNEYSNREFIKKTKQSSGGNFYSTTKKRISVTFASHINNAVKTGKLLYRDAYKLTALKGDTFQTFFSTKL